MGKKLKILGLIPTRLNSVRLPQKALLKIGKLPLIIHVYKRAKLSKKLNDVVICCDDKIIFDVAKKYKAKAIMTSKFHQNGTERCFEAYLKLKKKYDIILDIQGDEPLISPHHINQVTEFHEKNLDADIIIPNIKIPYTNNTNIVKVVFNKKKEILYLSRANVPYQFKKQSKIIHKHLSIISFLPNALQKFSESNQSLLEKIEDVELLRSLDIGLKLKTITLKGDSFSVDIYDDYEKVKSKMIKDKFYKIYK
jgi:3-deoxy-manno-octulosonate cytidylyltransferase (CMP-KDO synthetase)|tara:strand:+ start:412 stop:1167 length:756 start_codon:yes stop_codon:yes gene_type:complete